MKWFIEGSFIKNYHIAFTANFVGVLFVAFLLYCLASYFSGRYSKESFIKNFASFGYGLIPLGLAGHLAHNLFHLLKEGKNAAKTVLIQSGMMIGDLNALASSHQAMTGDDLYFKVAQVAVVLLGALGSFMVLVSVSGSWGKNPHFNWRRILPHSMLLASLGFIFIYMFLLPMNPRHFH